MTYDSYRNHSLIGIVLLNVDLALALARVQQLAFAVKFEIAA
jgi:hypothetical protein